MINFRITPYLIILLSLLSGCSSDIRVTSLVNNGYDKIQLIHRITEVEGAEVAATEGFSHPAELKADQIRIVLESIKVRQKSFFKWSDPQNLFLDEEIERLAPRLTEALQKANSDQWIYFSSAVEKPGFLVDRLRLSDGICYLKEGKLNVVFSNINFAILGDNSELKDGDPRLHGPETFYQFVVEQEKGYYNAEVDPKDPRLSKQKTQWLVFELEPFLRLNTGKSLDEKRKASAIEDPATRLKRLKLLHEQDLITDSEYELKRKQILGDL